MAYQLVLKRVNEEEKRQIIATHIAEMSGAQMQQIVNAISTKSISLGRDFSFEKAAEMKANFEAMGAEIIMKDLAAPVQESPVYDTDEDDEEEGVLLTHAEYIKALNKRSDIFTVEKDKKLTFIMPFAFILSMAFGFSLWSMNVIRVGTDFISKPNKTVSVTLARDLDKIETKKKDKPEEKAIQKEKVSLNKDKKPRTRKEKRRQRKGGGNTRSRVMQKGVFASLQKKITSETFANSDIFGKGGTATGMDAMLSGKKGVKKGGGSAFGKRTGGGPIGFGDGGGNKFGGGNDEGVDLSNLTRRDESNNTRVRRRKIKKVSATPRARLEGITGGRSQASIKRTVRNNMASLKYAYNRRLRLNPGMGGKIKLKWAIDEFGNVLHCRVVSSNINDKEFEKIIVKKIRTWAFGKIKIPGDVTEVTYPFVFTQ